MPTEQTYWCTSCEGYKRAWSNNLNRCWNCDRFTLNRNILTIGEVEALAVSNYLTRVNIEGQARQADLRRELDSRDSQISSLNQSLSCTQSRFSATQNQLTATANQLLAKNNAFEELNKKFNDLQIEIGKKDNELEEKTRKIEELKSMLGRSREEILDIKIQKKEERLDTIIQELGISRILISDLRKQYRGLIKARLDYDQVKIDDIEDEIETIKVVTLESGVRVGDMQKICRKVETIADLKIQQNRFHQEQFEARQQVALVPGGISNI